jgi:siroheme synthase
MFYTPQISECSKHPRRTTISSGWKMGEDERSKLATTVQPGEYWLIEQALRKGPSSLDLGALSSADIVIYDRPLAALVAQVLPIGRYAEPLFDNGEPQPAVSRRALRFATEGWRVAQLIEARQGSNQRLHNTVEALTQLRVDDLPLLAIAKRTVDGQQLRDGRLHDLPELIDEFAPDDPLTLILGPLVAGCAAPPHTFAGNGLAG